MGVQMVIELEAASGAQAILHAVEAYQKRLQDSMARTKRNLVVYEKKYGVETAYFLEHWTSEDLDGGDLDYVSWAGEAEILKGLEAEFKELENAQYQLP